MLGALPYLAFSMGLMSSFHCIGMCGPIALALPIQKGNKFVRLAGLMTYNFGRVSTYGFLGLILGSIGSSLVWIGYLRYLSVFSGLLMLGYVFWPAYLDRRFRTPRFWQKFIHQIKTSMAEMLRSKSLPGWLFLGILNGLLPCGLVYLALISSVATGGPLNGSLFMLLFGAGTLPAMMAVGFFKQWFTASLRTKMRKLTPVLIATAGILLVARGLMIQSPSSAQANVQTITICHGK